MKLSKFKQSENILFILFLLPAFFFIVIAQFYPLLYSFYISFTKWSLIKWKPIALVGLSNYQRVLQDSLFKHAFKISLIFACITTPVELVIGFLLAYMITGERKIYKITRTILVIPMTIAPVAVGTIWRMLLNTRAGLINYLLQKIGINGPNWLATPSTAFFSILIVDIWEWTPFAMIIFVAALSSIPVDLFSAAQIDGASRWQILRYITLPLIAPITVLIVLFRFIDSILVIDIIYTTTYGGPGFSTNVITFHIYKQALKYFNITYAAAASWILQIFCLLVAIVLLMCSGKLQEKI
ncbi:sugar ABC transporter permease [Candidatus Aerophobetes bacterium]|uniref:Sugar ABC transporter permease n=1 Tax=Aerophobetes bacterium TaxID=2030807 RepID=A0A662DFQ1_UNCAE|nr:MAG: sugar ABC transporter permease [Candidatus Aerophobetes bacterium]